MQNLTWIELESYTSVRVTLNTQTLHWRKQLIWEATRGLKSRIRDNQYNNKDAFMKGGSYKILDLFLHNCISGQ